MLDGPGMPPGLRLAVGGRPGAGRRTVAQALRAAGAVVVTGRADVALHVFTEVLTEEDAAALSAMVRGERPCLAVLNKADLGGFRGGHPLAVADRQCEEVTRRTGVPAAPLVALAARAGHRGLDDVVLVGLRTLTFEPAALVPGLRDVLLAELGLYGLAHAVAALQAGATVDGVAEALRRCSGMAGVLAAVHRAAAPVRYRMAHAGLMRAGRSEESATARAAAAADVLRSAGLRFAAPDSPPSAGTTDCLRAAVAWHRYARGPVRALHRDCARDLSRAWLRRWAQR